MGTLKKNWPDINSFYTIVLIFAAVVYSQSLLGNTSMKLL